MRKVRYYIFLGLLKCIALLPFWCLYRISDFIYFILSRVIHYRKRVITGNISRSFPELSQREVGIITNKFYRHLADVIVESVKLLHVSDEEMRRRIEVKNGDEVERKAADGRPVILFLGHYGNWEWAQEVSCYYRQPAFTCELYRPVKDKVMDDLMLRIRSRFNTTLVTQQEAIRFLLRKYRSNEQFLVGFISDQRPNSQNLHNWTQFLHQDTAFAVGGEEIGKHVNAHYFFLHVEKPRRGHYVMTFKEVCPQDDKTKFPYTLQYLRMMEENIRKQPELWLWSHNRWKFDREGNAIH